MPNTKFDAKSFNPEVFRYMVGRAPNLKMNEIVKSKALTRNPDIQAAFSSQNGTAYSRLAMRGLLDGEAVLYMRQRGLSENQARSLQIEGFVGEVVSHCGIGPLSGLLTEAVAAKLEKM